MSLFSRKSTIELHTELQRDAMIEKLEKAHIDFDIQEEKNFDLINDKVTYILRFNADDYKKAV